MGLAGKLEFYGVGIKILAYLIGGDDVEWHAWWTQGKE
jgi:hypothetical protein